METLTFSAPLVVGDKTITHETKLGDGDKAVTRYELRFDLDALTGDTYSKAIREASAEAGGGSIPVPITSPAVHAHLAATAIGIDVGQLRGLSAPMFVSIITVIEQRLIRAALAKDIAFSATGNDYLACVRAATVENGGSSIVEPRLSILVHEQLAMRALGIGREELRARPFDDYAAIANEAQNFLHEAD